MTTDENTEKLVADAEADEIARAARADALEDLVRIVEDRRSHIFLFRQRLIDSPPP